MSKRGFSAAVAPKQPKPSVKKAKPVPPTPSWQLLPESYKLFRDNIIIAGIIIILPTLILQLGGTLALITTTPLGLQVGYGLQVLASLLLMANTAVTILLQLRLVQGHPIGIYRLYRESFRYWLRIIGFAMLFALVLAVGLILFIVPGMIVLRRYALAPYFLVDEDLGIRQAMQRSAAASQPIRKHIWTMLAIILAFSGLGFVCTKLSPEYGGFVVALFPIIYGFLPALRYREAAHNLRLATVKE